jgi:hypothetical protein
MVGLPLTARRIATNVATLAELLRKLKSPAVERCLDREIGKRPPRFI